MDENKIQLEKSRRKIKAIAGIMQAKGVPARQSYAIAYSIAERESSRRQDKIQLSFQF